MLCRCRILLYVLYLPDFIGCCQSYWFWPHYSLWRHLFERSEQSSCVQCVWEETTRYWHDLRCLRWNQLQVVWVCNRSRPHPLAPSICVTTHVTPIWSPQWKNNSNSNTVKLWLDNCLLVKISLRRQKQNAHWRALMSINHGNAWAATSLSSTTVNWTNTFSIWERMKKPIWLYWWTVHYQLCIPSTWIISAGKWTYRSILCSQESIDERKKGDHVPLCLYWESQRISCVWYHRRNTLNHIVRLFLPGWSSSSTLIINHIKNILYENEKSCYVLSVGKINYPKLANLPGIDTYVLVGCPRSIFLNDDDTEVCG